MRFQKQVLVFPKSVLRNLGPFTPTGRAQRVLDEIQDTASWLEREEAEASTQVVQVIPCTILRNPEGLNHVLTRVRDARPSLSNRLSLIVGGHIDGPADILLSELARSTLMREISEELVCQTPEQVTPLGLVFAPGKEDTTSAHLALVYGSVVRGSVETAAGPGGIRARGHPHPHHRPPQDLTTPAGPMVQDPTGPVPGMTTRAVPQG